MQKVPGILAHREPSRPAPARNFYELESFPATASMQALGQMALESF